MLRLQLKRRQQQQARQPVVHTHVGGKQVDVSASVKQPTMALPSPDHKAALTADLAKLTNDSKAEEFIALCKQALEIHDSKQLDRPLKVLADNWVETCGDLKFLVQENELRGIGLPLRLCLWIEEQLKRMEATEIGGGVCLCVCVCGCVPACVRERERESKERSEDLAIGLCFVCLLLSVFVFVCRRHTCLSS